MIKFYWSNPKISARIIMIFKKSMIFKIASIIRIIVMQYTLHYICMSRIIVPAAATNKNGERKNQSRLTELDYDSIRSLSAVGVFSCRC